MAYTRRTAVLPEHEPHETVQSLTARAQAIRERVSQVEISTEERKQLAKDGLARPDGSYPIRNTADLKRAIRAYGRASDAASVKRWIVKRARELDATDMLPPEWGVTQASIADRCAAIRERRKSVKQDGDGDTSSTPASPSGMDDPSEAETMDGEKNPDQSLPGKRRKRKRKVTAQAALIVQADASDEKRVVHAVLQPPDEWTMPGSFDGEVALTYPANVVQQACWDFMAEMRNRAVGVMHGEINRAEGCIELPDGENAVVVENYIAPCDFAIGDRYVTKGSWVQAYRITADGLWQAIKNGAINAPSLTSIDFELEDLGDDQPAEAA